MAEREEEQRELITAVDRLNDQIGRMADRQEKNTDALDKVSKRTDSLTKVVKSSDELGKAGLSATRTGLKVGGSALLLNEARKRSGGLAKVAKASVLFGSTGGLVSQTVKLVSNLHPLLKAAGIAIAAIGTLKLLRGSSGKGGSGGGASSFSEQEKQTAILAALLRSSIKNNEQLSIVYGRARAAQDPFNRTPSFFADQRQSFTPMSNAPTQMQAKSAATLIAAQNESSAASQALAATIAQHFQPIQRLGAELDSRFKTNMNFWIQTIGAGKTLLDLALNDAMDFAFGAATQQAGRGGPLGGQAERDLFKLQTRGPGSVIGAPPTARAGTAGGYAVRVQLQRQSIQAEVTKAWQDQVLTSLKELVALGLVESDDLYRKRVEFGRPGI